MAGSNGWLAEEDRNRRKTEKKRRKEREEEEGRSLRGGYGRGQNEVEGNPEKKGKLEGGERRGTVTMIL